MFISKQSLVKTYCNPLPLSDFQPGVIPKEQASNQWYRAYGRPCERQDFREMADPTVIQWQGRWYLFPSRGMVWHSDDMVDWTFQHIGPFVTSDGRELWEIGYAPTVVQQGEYLLMTACWSGEMWRAKHPFGPWENLGKIKDENGSPFRWADPMLFVDDDGSLYCYHGLGIDGIYVVKMRDDDPTRFAHPRIHCFGFNPEHRWERFGEHNQNKAISYIEGACVLKRNGTYYLIYSGPGTEFKCYAVGCYKSQSPTGPWEYQKRNPVLIDRGGLVNGCGHATLVEGPGGTYWCFYTLSVRIEHDFERRVGMDPVFFDENGDIYVEGPTETPQFAPELQGTIPGHGDAGLVNLSAGCFVKASSSAPGRDPMYACDDHIRTWWEADGAAPQWLCVDLNPARTEYEMSAVRILFADRGLDFTGGALPGPYGYTVEGSLEENNWTVLVDCSGNSVDHQIAYHTFAPRKLRYVRINILKAPAGLRIGLWELTVFGK